MNVARTRLSQRCTSTTLRHASSSAIDRLHLDINAAAFRDESNAPKSAHQETITRSNAATMGKAARWDANLPIELVRAVDQLVQDYEGEKSSIRTAALELYEHLRSTSSLLPNHATHRSPSYTPLNSLAFLSGLMPSIYAATVHVLEMTRQRLAWIPGEDGKSVPDRVVDFGSGTGSGAWATRKVWNDSEDPVEYVGLDKDRSMVELGSRIIGALPRRMVNVDPKDKDEARSISEQDDEPFPTTTAKMYQLAIPASVSSFARLGIPLNPKAESSKSWDRTLVLSSFSLGELSTREKRKEFVRSMWETGANVIVIVERGTPRGSRIIKDAREQLLMYGAREAETGVGDEEQQQKHEDGDRGCFVLAPCAHDGACPLHQSTNMFCHFAQRVQSPAFHRATKHSTQGQEIARFSYIVIKRGSRPCSPPPSSLISKDFLSTSLRVNPPPPLATPSTSTRWTWPRILSPPSKRSGHIILDVCSSSDLRQTSGQIERHIIPKSQGRQAYYDARKSSWGDSFPHPPKNGAVPVQVDSQGFRLGKFRKDTGVEKQGWKEKGRKGWKRKEREASESMGVFRRGAGN
ncbi:BQ2448_3621 [Microbotryum intermedium]|uniref:BQ2448_3621 protein n=1 Tax=Microbotryum intermedium TaxID=269621 RepID=A0A238FDK4_9BASI|nr:BQ2448_3621 [Microbotryum intermedium]